MVCFLFSIINKGVGGVHLKTIEDLRENGRPIIYEETINNPEYHALCPPNISFKTLFHKLSSKAVI